MNAKEKAKEIACRFVTKSVFDMNNEELKQERIIVKKHAIACVDEIIKEYENNICYCGYDNDYEMWNTQKEEWVMVKNEIEALP